MRLRILTYVVLVIYCIYVNAEKRSCKDGKPTKAYPPTVKETSVALKALRKLMRDNNIQAYFVPSADDHQTEYVASWFKRRSFISGLRGSAGTAVITLDKAAVWTDGRYHDQAETQVDCNWIIQKQGLTGVPSITTWISQELKDGDKVGADPKVIKSETWASYNKGWDTKGIKFEAVQENLVDKVWTDRPTPTKEKVFVQPLKYSGQNYTEKISNLRKTLQSRGVGSIIVTALDDVAWLLNLRGKDIPYNPFFYGYIIVTMDDVTVFVDQDKMSDEVKKFISRGVKVGVKDYDDIRNGIKDLVNKDSKTIWIPKKSASYFLIQDIPEKRRYMAYSPIQLPKAMKNEVELEGMKKANVHDGIAIMEFFIWMQEQLDAGKKVTELSAMKKLKEFKSQQPDFFDLSFGTIAGYGPNGAIIHYKATKETDRQIGKDSLFLLDSGAQFPFGSTDITRTVCFGTPTAKMKETFTYVLQGSISLASVIFPRGTYGVNIDVLARQWMWEKGLNYRHGTGHGIGHFLSIHEGPAGIGGGKGGYYQTSLYNGMVFSDEPGYYESGEFGIRLETAIVVRETDTKYMFGGKKYLTFEAITWVPFQTKLIDYELLTRKQVNWLNAYNKKIREIVGPVIKQQGKDKVYKYMMDETAFIQYPVTNSSCSKSSPLQLLTLLLLLTAIKRCLY